MGHFRNQTRLVLALLATTMLTQPGPICAAPGDALGGKFQVNSFTMGNQDFPAVAMAADGDFVVAWTDRSGLDGWSYGIFAQRYDAAGVPQGAEFPVNTFTLVSQDLPSVAMDADGDFLVAWAGRGLGDVDGVFAQRFDATGTPQGSEFRVNTFTTGEQTWPAVAMDADGDFVVTWAGNGAGDSYGIFARRFDAAAVPQGPEFLVNGFATGNQRFPAAAMDADGDFVVAWTSYGQDDPGSPIDGGVFARRYDAAGAAQGSEFQVNATSAGTQSFASVAMDADGDVVAAWLGEDATYGSYGIFAQRYDAAGLPEGSELRVDTFTTGSQGFPSVAMDADGDFVVTWLRLDLYEVFARRFDAAGAAQSVQFLVDRVPESAFMLPAAAMDADGDFVLAWHSVDQDGNGRGVFAQRYDGAELVEGDFDGDGNADVLWRNTSDGKAFVWLLEGTERRAAQSIGIVPLVWEVAGTGDFNGDGKADILWRHTGNGTTVLWQMDGFAKVDSASIGKPPLVWKVEQLRDTDGDGNSDIFWRNTTTGGTLVWRMNGFTKTVVGSPGAAGPPWEVQ